MHITHVRIRRLAQGGDATAWRAALGDAAWPAASDVLKQEDGAWVRRATLLGRDVVVKCRPLSSSGRRMKAALGLGHADRHWRGADALRRIGVLTGAPLASALARVDGSPCELLVLEYLPGRSLIEVLAAISRGEGPPVRAQHAIARAVGRQVRVLASAGWTNRDHKPSNLIVAEGETGSIAVIDCVGLRRTREAGLPLLAALCIEPLGCNVLPRRTLLMRALRAWRDDEQSSAHDAWRAVARLVERHGDPRPRVNPLSR